MTNGELLDLLERVATEYRADIRASIRRNTHLNDLTKTDLKQIDHDPVFFQRVADAVLVDFINQVARGRGGDLGLKTGHIRR